MIEIRNSSSFIQAIHWAPFRDALKVAATVASRHRATARIFAVLILPLLFCSASAWAQKDTGAIDGTVKDSSGKVVVGAKITVTDVDRGTVVETVSNGVGDYTASPLRVGRYKISVEKTRIQNRARRPGDSGSPGAREGRRDAAGWPRG